MNRSSWFASRIIMLRTCPLDADCCTQAGCTISQIRQCHKGNDACRLDVPYGVNGASHCIDCIHRIASGQESVTRSNERGRCVPPAIGSSGNEYYSEDVCHSNDIDGDKGQRQRPTTEANDSNQLTIWHDCLLAGWDSMEGMCSLPVSDPRPTRPATGWNIHLLSSSRRHPVSPNPHANCRLQP